MPKEKLALPNASNVEVNFYLDDRINVELPKIAYLIYTKVPRFVESVPKCVLANGFSTIQIHIVRLQGILTKEKLELKGERGIEREAKRRKDK